MNQNWQNFLSTQGAQIQDGVVQHFGDSATERLAARDGTVLCDLSQFGILKVSGEDAQSFLQNLLSNDIREVNGNRAQLSSINNAKGRMLAGMLVWRSSDDYLLQLPRGLCETIRKKLSMYVLRAKVKISDVSDEIVCIGISGSNAQTTVQALYPTLPQQAMDVLQHDADTVLRRDARRFQIASSPQQGALLWQALSKVAKPVGSPCWDWLDIRAGIPFIQPATLEAFVPQMVNFEVIGGVNFKKGCYPGQEVVARMHYLGKPKRRMYLAHLESDIAPQAGDELYSAELEGQSCGTVVTAVAAPQGGFELLAVVQAASHDTFPVHLGGLTGARLQFETLPYPLP
ncbi:MAG: folate-binding protein YgfZ [Sideroxyarcus sp.]|nr:folate-binding protein YgfZ [Sideroxyarcus sp.]